MNNLNNSNEDKTRTLVSSLDSLFKEYEHRTSPQTPLVVTLSYIKNGSELLVPYYRWGILTKPVIIRALVKSEKNIVEIVLDQNDLVYKIGDKDWRRCTCNLEIPEEYSVVNGEKYVFEQSDRNILSLEVPKEENVLNIFLGNSAYGLLPK